MNLPQTVNLGYPFNLTCSVQLSQTNSAYITVDWFRPDHSYDGLQHSVSRSSNVTAPVSGLPSLSNVEEPLPLYDNASAVISWFAHSFTQVVNQPSFGNSLYKQLRIEEDFTYQSEAVFSVQKATAFEEGFYECRAYEPVNYGHERVLDRAITAIVGKRLLNSCDLKYLAGVNSFYFTMRPDFFDERRVCGIFRMLKCFLNPLCQ